MEARKIIFVTGKGGVGKTTVSLIMARELAAKGKRVLVVELGEKSSIQHLIGTREKPQYLPRKTEYGFDWAIFQGRDCLEDYVSSFVRMESLASMFLNNKLMQAIIPLAPGLDDLSILGKLTSGIRRHGPPLRYDHIIVDGFSSGSFLSMLKSPVHLSKMVQMGPLNYHSLKIYEVLKNRNLCQYVFVTLLENLPVDELRESTADFYETFELPFMVVTNKFLPQVSLPENNPPFADFLKQTYEAQDKYFGELKGDFDHVAHQNLICESLEAYLEHHRGEELRKTLESY